jgi:hypothetical protein
MKYLDLFKKEINVGDHIIYSAVDGRSGVLRVGQVIELTKAKETYSGKVIPKIKAKSACWGWKDTWERQRDVSLGFFERIAVVSKESLSPEAVKILKN